MIVPEYSAAMTFPAVVKLPVQVALDLGIARVVVINTAQDQLPEGVVTYLKNDLRYRGWFV